MNVETIIKDKISSLNELNIIIAGMTCSGKTTLSNMIKEQFSKSVTSIGQDSYFKDLKNIPRNKNGFLMDSLNAFNIDEFVEDVETLLIKKEVYIPNYDISKNKRISKDILIKKGKINIFEGLHTITLLDKLENCLKIYIDSPFNICLERRIDRDYKNYGIKKEQVIYNFNSCILPISRMYINKQMSSADIIVDERGKVLCR